ncbi:MAG: hypothetical protein ACR2FE_03690 [Aeromicrobium sp.]
MERQHRGLRIVMTIDAWLSFSAPPIVLIGIPLLVVHDAPGWLVAATVLTLAGILGGCGIIMVGILAVAAARGRMEFPEHVLTELHVAGWEDPRPAVPSR